MRRSCDIDRRGLEIRHSITDGYSANWSDRSDQVRRVQIWHGSDTPGAVVCEGRDESVSAPLLRGSAHSFEARRVVRPAAIWIADGTHSALLCMSASSTSSRPSERRDP